MSLAFTPADVADALADRHTEDSVVEPIIEDGRIRVWSSPERIAERLNDLLAARMGILIAESSVETTIAGDVVRTSDLLEAVRA